MGHDDLWLKSLYEGDLVYPVQGAMPEDKDSIISSDAMIALCQPALEKHTGAFGAINPETGLPLRYVSTFIFVRVGDKFLLITAGHNFIRGQQKLYKLLQFTEDYSRFTPLHTMIKEDTIECYYTKPGEADIACVELLPLYAERWEDRFLTWSYEDYEGAQEDLESCFYVMLGFPEEKIVEFRTPYSIHPNLLHFEVHGYSFCLKPAEIRKPEGRIVIDYENAKALSFDRKTEYNVESIVGISGSGIWAAAIGKKELYEQKFRLVGIENSWNENNRIYGTRIVALQKLMDYAKNL